MRPFKLFWGWTKNKSSSFAQGFFNFLLCPKVFPSYLPPPSYLPRTYFTSFCVHSIAIAKIQESLKLEVKNLKLEAWNKRAKVGARSRHLNREGRSGRAKMGTRRIEVGVRNKCLKRKGRNGSLKWEGKSESLKVSSFYSFHLFFVVLLVLL
jgi:hypothetical protein